MNPNRAKVGNEPKSETSQSRPRPNVLRSNVERSSDVVPEIWKHFFPGAIWIRFSKPWRHHRGDNRPLLNRVRLQKSQSFLQEQAKICWIWAQGFGPGDFILFFVKFHRWGKKMVGSRLGALKFKPRNFLHRQFRILT